MPIPLDDPILLAPSPTPFRPDDSIDFEAIERNVRRWRQTPLTGFVLNSENGEEAFLSEAERLEIVRTVQRANEGEKLIVGGVDCPSVTESLRLAEALVEAGAELLRVRIPRLTENVQGYFEALIPRAPAPIIMIHQMAPGKFLSTSPMLGASAELLGELASLDNVFGYITSDNLRFEARARTFIPPEKRFWIANGGMLLAGAAIGANGGCMMLGNVAPGPCLKILSAVMQGDLATAQREQNRLLETDWQILSRGSAGVKAALNLLGFEAGRPRTPAPACSEAAISEIKLAMQNAGILPAD